MCETKREDPNCIICEYRHNESIPIEKDNEIASSHCSKCDASYSEFKREAE